MNEALFDIGIAAAILAALLLAWGWLLQTRQQRAQWDRDSLWDHECEKEGIRLSVGAGEACNWCGAVEKDATT